MNAQCIEQNDELIIQLQNFVTKIVKKVIIHNVF